MDIKERKEDILVSVNGCSKIESLQALRALAFLSIFLFHAHGPFIMVYFAVTVFFVLSGFLLMYRHGEEDGPVSVTDNLRFAAKKISGIYPLHIITMLISVGWYIALMILKGDVLKRILNLFICLGFNITLTQSWIPIDEINVSLNGVAWYLSVIVFLYFLFPWISRLIRRINKTSFLIPVCAVLLLMQILISAVTLDKSYGTWATYIFPVFRVADFFTGCSFGYIYRNRKSAGQSVAVATVIEVLAVAITVSVELWKNAVHVGTIARSINNRTTLYILLAVLWIWLFAERRGVITKLLSNRYLIGLGNISAYTYLIHFVFTQYTTFALNFFDITGRGIWTLAIVFEFAATLIATTIYVNLEKKYKILRLSERIFSMKA